MCACMLRGAYEINRGCQHTSFPMLSAGKPDPTPLLESGLDTNDTSTTSCKLRSGLQLKRRVLRIVISLIFINAAIISLMLILGHQYPSLISAGVLALSFGLRHAVDADHIAAIDNVTRRLIEDGRQPLLVGLWFSLGHSSVVCLICIAAACGAAYLKEHNGFVKSIGALLSTAVSAGMLLFIGIANLMVVMTSSSTHSHAHGGLLMRWFSVLLKAVDSEWKMIVLGFVFGLGFETSSEVALLALAAMSPSQGIPPVCTLVLPLLFAGGMSMIDTLDGLLMSWAYGFAVKDDDGSRRLYNLYLTTTSSVIAIVVGLIELLGCVQHELVLEGPFWTAIAAINDNFEYVGYTIIGFFSVSAIAAIAAFTWPARLCGRCLGEETSRVYLKNRS
mmetsp:Transcript_62493/g.103991  ORF Transcript_62493/g.103991 Transcript_62493/m.103991 type:complete len:390 (+) Transcript_62493:138-1307(+)